MIRRIHRTDGNHAETVELFRKAGWSARSTAMVGDDFPDIVVAKHGFTAVVEVKLGRWPSERKLTEGQAEFRDGWQGCHIHAITPDGALRLANQALKDWGQGMAGAVLRYTEAE